MATAKKRTTTATRRRRKNKATRNKTKTKINHLLHRRKNKNGTACRSAKRRRRYPQLANAHLDTPFFNSHAKAEKPDHVTTAACPFKHFHRGCFPPLSKAGPTQPRSGQAMEISINTSVAKTRPSLTLARCTSTPSVLRFPL